jgi:hypothetical protein
MLRVRLIPVVLVLVALSTAAFVLWGATPASTTDQ